jgi:hypothetical protein
MSGTGMTLVTSRHLFVVVAWLSALLGPLPVAGASAAQSSVRVVSQEVLESIEHLDCTFATRVSGTWVSAQPVVTVSEKAGQLSLDISEINVVDGSATARDRGRTAAVSARSDRSNLYFFEVGPDDAVVLTTVFSQEAETGRLKAVHTRTGRNPAQFYGDCRVVN